MARTLSALRPIVEAWEWQSVGRCREPGSAQFFHPDEDLGRISRRLREAAAIRLCQSCPVRAQCATHALAVGEEYGVWGGFTENDRTVLRGAGWRDTLGTDRLVDVVRLRQRVDRTRAGAASTAAAAASAAAGALLVRPRPGGSLRAVGRRPDRSTL